MSDRPPEICGRRVRHFRLGKHYTEARKAAWRIMMRKPDTYISVWFDDTSDEPGWIVDRCDEDDNSHTVKIYDDECIEAEEKARAFAKRYAEKTGLPIR